MVKIQSEEFLKLSIEKSYMLLCLNEFIRQPTLHYSTSKGYHHPQLYYIGESSLYVVHNFYYYNYNFSLLI